MRRLLLLALPTSAAFGSLLPGVSVMFNFRLMILLLGLLTIGSSRANTTGLRTVTTFRVLVVVWAVVGFVGSVFAQDRTLAAHELLALFLGFFLAYLFIVSEDSYSLLRDLRAAWVAAFLVTGFIGVRELLTGTHWSNYLESFDATLKFNSNLVASVFGNPNGYAAFLVITFALLANGLLEAKTPSFRLFYFSLMMLLCLLMVSTGSRLCLYALVLEGLVFFRFYRSYSLGALVWGGVFMLLTINVIGAGASDSIGSRITLKSLTASPLRVMGEVVTSGGSSEVRLNIYRDGLWMIGDSSGIGVGPGQFQVVMASGKAPYYSQGTLSPHNLYLEIASQYGLMVFVLFMTWVAVCFRICLRAARTSVGSDRSWGVAMVVALAGNTVSALASSGYLTFSFNWVFMATLLLVAVTVERNFRRGHLAESSSGMNSIAARSNRSLLPDTESAGS